MILTRRKQPPKTIKNGIYEVIIESITESLQNNRNVLIFKFNSVSGRISLILPINTKLHSILCNLMDYCDIDTFTSMTQFIGCKIKIEVVNSNIKYLMK